MIVIWILVCLIVHINSDLVCQNTSTKAIDMETLKKEYGIEGNNATFCENLLQNNNNNNNNNNISLKSYDSVIYIPKAVELQIDEIDDAYKSSFKIKWKIKEEGFENCNLTYEVVVSNDDLKYNTNKKTITLEKLKTGKLYEIKITPLVNGCRLSESKSKKFWTTINPDKPSDLKVQQILADRKIKLEWKASKHSEIFIVRYNNISYTANSTVYTFKYDTCKEICADVFSKNAKGTSESVKKCFFVYDSNFNKVEFDKINSQNKTNFKLGWKYKINDCIKHFEVIYRDLSSSNPTSHKFKSITNSYNIKNFKIGHIYEIEVNPIGKEIEESVEELGKPIKQRNRRIIFTGKVTQLLTFSQPKVVSKILTIDWKTKKIKNIGKLIKAIKIFIKNDQDWKNIVYCIVNKNFAKFQDDCKNVQLVEFDAQNHGTSEIPLFLSHNYKTIYVKYNVVMDLESHMGSLENIQLPGKFPTLEILSGLFLMIAIMMTLIAIIYYNKDQKRRLIRIRRNQEESLMLSDPITLRNRIMRQSTLHDKEMDKNFWANCSQNLENFLEKIKGYHVDLEKFCTYFDTISTNENAELISQYKAIGEDAEKIEKHLNLSRFMGKSPINSKKNRFFNVLPFDQTRVLLVNNPDSETYINANYIPRLDDPNIHEYIASQGPIESMINDFILMIWEQNTRVVVMLTKTVENDVKKCIQYWPESVEEEIYFGNNKEFKMKMISEKTESSYIERELLLKYKKMDQEAEEERIIIMIHMVTWSDYTAPKLDEFTLVLNRFKELTEFQSADEGPYLVHCSAGVGRTGTFICLDRIVKQLSSGERFVDVYKTVLRLRAYRNYLVQRPAQYIFIHEFLNYYIDKYFSGPKKTSSHVSLTCEPQVNLEEVEEVNPIITEE